MGRLASFVRRIIQLEIRMKRKSSSNGEANQKKRRITPTSLPTTQKKSRTKIELPSHTTLPPNSIWCDGGCTDNGFPEAKGGFGVVSSSFAYSWPLPGELQTNNRAELMALFVALLAAPEKEASTIYSDSTYAMNAVFLLSIYNLSHVLKKKGQKDYQWPYQCGFSTGMSSHVISSTIGDHTMGQGT
jgi:hypothetical protein